VISPTQRPLPDNTQHSQETDIHAPGTFWTSNPSKLAAADPHLRHRGHQDQHTSQLRNVILFCCANILTENYKKMVITADTVKMCVKSKFHSKKRHRELICSPLRVPFPRHFFLCRLRNYKYLRSCNGDSRMTSELWTWKHTEQNECDLTDVLHLFLGTKENHENPVRTAGHVAKIPSGYLPMQIHSMTWFCLNDCWNDSKFINQWINLITYDSPYQ